MLIDILFVVRNTSKLGLYNTKVNNFNAVPKDANGRYKWLLMCIYSKDKETQGKF